MRNDLIEEIQKVLDDYEHGGEICVSRGMAGYDLSDELGDLICTQLKQALEVLSRKRKQDLSRR